MDATYKIQFTLPNGATFSAEGPQETVQQAFEKFLASAEKTPSAPIIEQKDQRASLSCQA